MECDRCRGTFAVEEARELHGQKLCEDCYMDSLSPAKACDPWAVYSAKSFASQPGAAAELTETQTKILQILQETGGTEAHLLAARLQLTPSDLERDLATLRHMEQIRGELREGKKVIRLW